LPGIFRKMRDADDRALAMTASTQVLEVQPTSNQIPARRLNLHGHDSRVLPAVAFVDLARTG